MMAGPNLKYWILWLLLSAVLGAYLAYTLIKIGGGDVESGALFLPGQATHGHHNIEMACTECHAEAFGGKTVLQNACVNCHGDELDAANDSHPKSKFTDPRNVATLEKIDARYCVTCHVEHHPEMTRPMGVTLQDDYCFYCHEDIADDLPDHSGLDFTSCATGGCHNFHDNTALYEDFLVKHLHEPVVKAEPLITRADISLLTEYGAGYPSERYPNRSLTMKDQDAPKTAHVEDTGLMEDWLVTAHAGAGVNCTACHEMKTGDDTLPVWRDNPGTESCQQCHATETKGFMAGKHGMRLAAGLGMQTPAMAKLPMNPDQHDSALSCTSCHSAHRFDIKEAAVEACLGCHEDQHSKNYKQSPHFDLLQDEWLQKKADGSGVSCASCHMPRVSLPLDVDKHLLVTEHNQNANLRPNEKMVRSVCLQCHGLEFVLDSLADRALIDSNFTGRPKVHVKSLEMAEKKQAEHEEKEP